MNTDFLTKSTVLVLNSIYQTIGVTSPKKALVALNSFDGNIAKSIDISYEIREDGLFDLENVSTFQAYSFEEWLMVDFRDGLDRAIHTTKLSIRCPTVVVVTNYSKMPMRRFRPTKSLLYSLQKGICAYSGKQMSMKAMNIEHKKAKSHGGKDTFENLVVVDSKINHARGNRPLEEMGLRSIFNHKEPRPLPASYAIKDSVHPDWNYWLAK